MFKIFITAVFIHISQVLEKLNSINNKMDKLWQTDAIRDQNNFTSINMDKSWICLGKEANLRTPTV